MKKIALLVLASLMLVACGGKGSKLAFDENAIIDKNEMITLVTEKDYEGAEGKSVEFGGMVYMDSSADEEHVYYNVHLDTEYGKEVVVKVAKGSETYKDGDFVLVKGFFISKSDVEKIDDGFLTYRELLVVETDSIEKTDYQTAFSPTLKTVDLDLKQDQNGLVVTLEKIEFAEEETRLYVSADNGTDSKISIYSFDFVIVANNKNYEESRGNYVANYPDLTTSLNAGTKTEGIVVYESIDFKNLDGMKVIVDRPFSDNWDLDFEDFVFEIPASLLK